MKLKVFCYNGDAIVYKWIVSLFLLKNILAGSAKDGGGLEEQKEDGIADFLIRAVRKPGRVFPQPQKSSVIKLL